MLVLWQNPVTEPDHNIASVDYTHCSVARGVASYSTLDHFVTTQRVYNAISEAGVIHSGENPSNHSAIYSKIKVGDLDLSLETSSAPVRVQWAKANSDAQNKYKTCLSEKLNKLILPDCASCQDIHCQEHREEMEDYTVNIMEAIETAAKECLPLTGGSSKGKGGSAVAGWSEHVKPYADESKFWDSVWQSMGSPTHGDVFNNMRSSKNQYKKAVRRLKRVNDKIIGNKFLASVIEGDCNIFQEIRKLRGSSTTYSSRIDNEVGSSNIANHFANIYSEQQS